MSGENESLDWWESALDTAGSLSDTVVDIFGDWTSAVLISDRAELEADKARIAQEQSKTNDTANQDTVPTSLTSPIAGYPLWAWILGAIVLVLLLFVLLKAVL